MRVRNWGLLGLGACALLASLSGCSREEQSEDEVVGSSSQAIASPIGTTLVFSSFSQNSGNFGYSDNGFRSTSASAYASGSYSSSSGNLTVDLGGIDGTTVNGISGGWSNAFNVTESSRLILSFDYVLTQSPNYESDERSEVLVSIDGNLRGLSGNDYVARVVGNGDGGPDVSTGLRSATIDLGVLGAGAHTIKIGGYNNKKTLANESTRLTIDNVRLGASPSAAPAALSCDTASCCPAGKTVVSGTNASEALTNNTANRCLVMLDGSDTVASYGSGSAVLGGNGDDTIMAGTGASVRGGAGRDTINGFSGGTVLGGPGDDTITGANGNNFIYPGAGIDNVSAGTGNDTIVIYDLCEVSWGDQIDAGTGNDTLITPVPLAQLQALGVTVANVENIVVQKNSCKSECVANACSGNGTCVEGATGGQVKCDCQRGYSGADCGTLGEPTVPVTVNPGIGTPIPGYLECKDSNLAFVNGDNPALPIDEAHPERRRIVYTTTFTPGCEAKFCSVAADGSETVLPNATEAQLNAAPPASSTCPALPATPAPSCGIDKKSLVLTATCVNDVDCQTGYVCARVCTDTACVNGTSKHCGKLSESCAGMPAENASCDNTGTRFCSNQGPKRASTEAELTPPLVTATPASMIATPNPVPPTLSSLDEVDGCGNTPPVSLLQADPWESKDDGSSMFGIFFEPTLEHNVQLAPSNLAEVATVGLNAKAAFATGVVLFGDRYPAIEADAHASLTACKRDVAASFKVFGETVAGKSMSIGGGLEDADCKDLAAKWTAISNVMIQANQSAHQARKLFTTAGPNRELCRQVKTQIINNEMRLPGTPVPVNSLHTSVPSSQLDCESPTNLAASATLAANILIDDYKFVQTSYANALNAYVTSRNRFKGGDTLQLNINTPFSIAGYSQTFFIGPIPVTIDARIFGEYGVSGGITWALGLDGLAPTVSGSAGVGPHFALEASVFAGVGIPAASIGVEGKLLLLSVDPKFNVGLTLQGEKVNDDRPIGDWTGAALPNFPRKIAKWKTPWSYGASMTISTLSGSFDAVARLKLFFFTKTWRKQIFSWRGPSWTTALTSGGADSPMQPTPAQSDLGGYADEGAYTGVANVIAAEAPAMGNPDALFTARIPGQPCVRPPR